ncbi:hypothetical protein XI00_38250 [Bradyrhizobium sp. CCBAU 21359]|nr:hypothetical protein [Bradyrhizobium sp. CCBAU 21359]
MLDFVAEAFDLGQNLVCGLGSLEELSMFIAQINQGANVSFELPDESVDTSAVLVNHLKEGDRQVQAIVRELAADLSSKCDGEVAVSTSVCTCAQPAPG